MKRSHFEKLMIQDLFGGSIILDPMGYNLTCCGSLRSGIRHFILIYSRTLCYSWDPLKKCVGRSCRWLCKQILNTKTILGRYGRAQRARLAWRSTRRFDHISIRLWVVNVWGKRFKLPQLTHVRFLTIDHSCKIFFWYLPNWTSTDLWCVVLYVAYSTTHQRLVEVQFGRYQKNILQEWSMVKKLSCVSCGSLKRFPHTFTTQSLMLIWSNRRVLRQASLALWARP
jgi:hypothetical protein